VVVARRSGSPTQQGVSASLMAVMVFDEDPDRARRLLRDGLDATDNPSFGNMRGTALLRLGRLERTIEEPEWARTFRPCLASVQHAGDRRAATILLELYSRALAEAGNFEIAGTLRWALTEGTMIVGDVSDAEQRATEDQIERALGGEKASELRALGDTMDIDEAIDVALVELDRVIATG